MRNIKRKKLFSFLAFLIIAGLAVTVGMLLWNALLPAIFGISTISFWQTAGLMLLFRLLLGGFGRFGQLMHPHFHHSHPFTGEKRGSFYEMYQKMKGMSREERLKFIHRRMEKKEDEGTETT